MILLAKKKQSKDTAAFDLPERIGEFINQNKSSSSKVHCFKFGYNYAMISAALASYQNLTPEEITEKTQKVFEKEQFDNNPIIDKVFQIIAYSDAIDNASTPEEKENTYQIISDLNKCRIIGRDFTVSGFTNIYDLHNRYEKSEINEQLLYQFKDILFTVEDLRDKLEKEEDSEKTISNILYALNSSFVTQDSKFKLVKDIDKYLIKLFRQSSPTNKMEILDIFNHILNNPIYNYPIDMTIVISLIKELEKSDEIEDIKKKAKKVINSFEETKANYFEIKEKKEEAMKKVESFEKNIRTFIKNSLKQHYGREDWWENGIPDNIKADAIKILNQEKEENPQTEYKPIQFLTFDNYRNIILRKKNWDPIFSKIFKEKVNIDFPFRRLIKFRNALFHSHLDIKDLDKYKTYIDEIMKYIS